ncbi:TonB-dependent receptor [Massilia sp. BJB1822]|uniref:TonB-dependent receptor n=1 Tax=Massilia sp. BJB1822 TaxID=2744470 RepID=UPI0015948331|nr:TonB-dependent receptor [Massilia sp. BJB1822]NVD99290.1 TonB-dependent receptor [Massilia sp. BJB1822]
MLRKTTLVRALTVAFGTSALTAAMVQPAMAQANPPAAEATPTRVVVTGSLISRADKETPSPVQVLSSDDLIKSGYTSVAEVLSNLTANGQGALSNGFAGAFANGGSGVSLRGLTVGLTLVLIDGHRMAPYPLSDDGQRSFVDVSAIPFDAIERVEVLKDGASSVYGSDAISGVVNIILKKNFNGTSIKADAGRSQHGGGRNYKVALTTGIGDLQADGYNAFISLEHRNSDRIRMIQRKGLGDWTSNDWSNRGGLNLERGVPNAGNARLAHGRVPFFYRPGEGGVNNPANFQFLAPGCNHALYMAGGCAVPDTESNIQPDSENTNVLAGFTKTLNQDWTLAVKASRFQRNSQNNRGLPLNFSQATFAGFTSLIPGQPPKVVNTIPSTLFPNGVQGNNLGGPARLYGIIPGIAPAASTESKTVATRLVADLDGTIGAWTVKAAAGVSRVKATIGYNGYVNRVALYNALNAPDGPGKFNPLGGNSADLLAQIAPSFSNESTSDLSFVDANFGRELMQLPGGPLSLAAGVSYIKKKLNAPPADLMSRGIVNSGNAYASGKETNTAAYAELNAAVLKNLELNASARYDHFDTYGNSFTPKVGFKFKPHEMASLRGTFSKGFRAPSATENGVASSTFNFNTINDPVLCADGSNKTKGNVVTACGMTPTYVQLTNKDLAPEKSKSYTLGLILEPMKNLSATLDYYHIKVTGQINSAAGVPGFVPVYFRNAPVPTDISDGKGGTYVDTPSVGTIAYITSPFVNAGSTETSGVEMDLSYKHKLGDLGTAKVGLTVNHMINYKLTSGDKTVELAGTHGPSAISGNTGNPRNRAQLTLGWDRGPLTTTATANWVSSYSGLDPAGGVTDCADAWSLSSRGYYSGGSHQPLEFCKIKSFTTVDLNVLYRFDKNLTLKASILNLFDKRPPLDVATYGNAGSNYGYNATLHQAGAVGRFFSLGASYNF